MNYVLFHSCHCSFERFSISVNYGGRFHFLTVYALIIFLHSFIATPHTLPVFVAKCLNIHLLAGKKMG